MNRRNRDMLFTGLTISKPRLREIFVSDLVRYHRETETMLPFLRGAAGSWGNASSHRARRPSPFAQRAYTCNGFRSGAWRETI